MLAARAELFEAADFYSRRKQGLGDEFLDEAMRVAQFIKQYPMTSMPRRHGVRKRGLDRFPYGIVYLVRDNEIVIVAVAHWKRRPAYWRRRLPGAR